MIFDSNHFGEQDCSKDDRQYVGSRYAEVRKALFESAYYLVWGGATESPLPVFDTGLWRMLKGLLRARRPWLFLQAARRTVESKADLRWGADRRGFRRILHPNGVCLLGTWEIDDYESDHPYTGYLAPKRKGLIIARYSTGIGIRRGDWRTLSLVGKIYPTTDPNHETPLQTANFITQEEFGGAQTQYVNDAELLNAPNTTPWRRPLGDVPKLLVTGLALFLADAKPTIRQLYQVAELDKDAAEATCAPEFMRLKVDPDQPSIYGDDLDFRDEILAQIYDKADPQRKRDLTFTIEVSDEGKTRGRLIQRRIIKNWSRIGKIVFKEAVASYNGDFVLHFHHPPWRNDPADPNSTRRKRGPSCK